MSVEATDRPPGSFRHGVGRAPHGLGNPRGPGFPTGNGWTWLKFQGNFWGGAVTGGQQGSHNISQRLRL